MERVGAKFYIVRKQPQCQTRGCQILHRAETTSMPNAWVTSYPPYGMDRNVHVGCVTSLRTVKNHPTPYWLNDGTRGCQIFRRAETTSMPNAWVPSFTSCGNNLNAKRVGNKLPTLQAHHLCPYTWLIILPVARK